MDKIIVTVPDWVVVVVAIWILLSAIESGMNIYLFYLKRKLEKIAVTTTTTCCDHEWDTWEDSAGQHLQCLKCGQRQC